jgi:hypothetical protein
MSRPHVLVSGALAGKAGHGGEAWVRLGWIAGAQRGCDVTFVEVAEVSHESTAASYFDDVVEWSGLTGRAALLDPDGRTVRGIAATELEEIAASADLLIDISGTLRGGPVIDRLRRAVRRRAYVDVDPGYTQLWAAEGLLGDHLTEYTLHLTVGDAVARCGLPQNDLTWHPVRPPIDLDQWPTAAGRAGVLSTIASWRGAYGPLVIDGQTFGGKVHQFRRLRNLPRAVPQRCEVALDIHPADAADVAALRDGGWDVLDPRPLTHSPDAYRCFIQSADGELSVAQGMYVGTQCGWISDRTAAYLASGKPAVIQDTGFDAELRTGGLLPFRTQQDAVDACREIARDPIGHAAAARSLAEQYFAADRVVAHVLDLAGV